MDKFKYMLTQKQLGAKIKRARQQRGLSQEEVAKSIGLSRAALSELERGNRCLDVLELIKISKFFDIRVDDFLTSKKPEVASNKIKQKEVNLDIEFKPEKLRQLLLYILSKCGGKPNIGETVLYKLLYFIDFDAYEILGKPVTGMNYVHQKFGPMPQLKQYQGILKEMKFNKKIEIFNQDYCGMAQKRYLALADYDLNNFSSREKGIIDRVLNQLSDMNARQIEGYVHGDAPWQATEENEIIPYGLVIYRKLPYAQRDYEQMWQDAAASDTLSELGEMSDEECNYYKNL